MKKKIIKWFNPKRETGWEKSMPSRQRRTLMLKAHKNNLSAARACQALANVTEDKETKNKAARDAKYFYRQHRQEKHTIVKIKRPAPSRNGASPRISPKPIRISPPFPRLKG